MAWALQFDGSNDYLPISTLSIPASTPFDIEFTLSFTANYARVFGVNNSATRSRCLVFYTSQTVRLSDSSGNSIEFTAPAYTKTDHNKFRFIRDASNNVDFYLNDVFIQTISGFSGAFSINQIGKNSSDYVTANSQLQYLKFDINGVASRNWSADASDHSNTGAQPVLVDTVGGNDATGSGFPTDGSAWVDLGGSISVTEQIVNTNYTSNDPIVTLTGTISIEENLVNTDYTSLDPTITLTPIGVISVTEQAVNTNYTSLDPIIGFTGLVSITEQVVNTNYEVNNPAVTLTSTNIDITESTVNTQYSTHNPSILLTPEPLGIVSTVCFNGCLVELGYNGTSKSVVFNGQFKELTFNGTIQTTCNTGSIKTNC